MKYNKFIFFVAITFFLLSCVNKPKTPPVNLSLKEGVNVKTRYKIGIAFGGGGAKAASEIGVLKIIEKADIPIEFVSGSSMGAVIGGLYAAGYSAKEIEDLLMAEEWLTLFDRNELGITVEDNERTIFGLIKGDEFQNQLEKALARKGCYNIEDTERLNNIKFSCTATNVVNKERLEEVDLCSGNMAQAIRASLTYPAPIVGYNPVKWGDLCLVDGGMLNNLPVDVVKKLGASKVIAIDLEKERNNKKKKPIDLSQLKEIIGITIPIDDVLGIKWLLDWLWDHSESDQKRRNNYNDADIKLRPDMKGYSILSFNERAFREMINAGELEAQSWYDELVKLKSNK
jgi:NTE family protein